MHNTLLDRHRIQLIYVLLMVSLLCACHAANNEIVPNITDNPNQFRIIVGFNSSETDPDSREIIQTIRAKLSSNVIFLRKLSGNAAIYRVETQLDAGKISMRLEQLTEITEIKYAELDQRRRIQSNQK